MPESQHQDSLEQQSFPILKNASMKQLLFCIEQRCVIGTDGCILCHLCAILCPGIRKKPIKVMPARHAGMHMYKRKRDFRKSQAGDRVQI